MTAFELAERSVIVIDDLIHHLNEADECLAELHDHDAGYTVRSLVREYEVLRNALQSSIDAEYERMEQEEMQDMIGGGSDGRI